MIENRLIHYFLVVAREQNMTRAAAQLHISQPTLSSQIADLEAHLGMKLFKRTNKNTLLTEDGMRFRVRAQELMELMGKIEDEFTAGEGDITGDIYLGCGETHIMAYISFILQKIHLEYPNIHFHIYSGDEDAVLERLDKGLLDIGLLLGPENRENCDYLPLGRFDSFGLLVPKESPLAKEECITAEMLEGFPLILPDQFARAEKKLLPDEMKANMVSTYNLITNATYMVEAGLGFALCLSKLVITEGRSISFIPLSPEIKAEACIVTKKYAYLPKAARLLMDALKKDISQ